MDIIELFSWLAKVMLYGATASVLGALFLRNLSENHAGIVVWLLSYIRWGSVIGMTSIVMSCMSQLLRAEYQQFVRLGNLDHAPQ